MQRSREGREEQRSTGGGVVELRRGDKGGTDKRQRRGAAREMPHTEG